MSRLGDDIFHLSKVFKSNIESRVKVYGIGIGQLQVLILLYSSSEKQLTQKELTIKLNVDKGNISRSLSKLLDKGYISISKNDNRIKTIKLTSSGLKVMKEMSPLFSEINILMTKNIGDKDIEIFHKILQLMISNLEEDR